MSANSGNISLLARFARYHRDNPQIYALFKEFTNRLIARGFKRTSAWLVINRIRWEVNVETYGDEFKICNNYVALYARLFVTENPQHNAVFKLKRMKHGNEPTEEWLQSLLLQG